MANKVTDFHDYAAYNYQTDIAINTSAIQKWKKHVNNSQRP